jgi:hypothetical protein
MAELPSDKKAFEPSGTTGPADALKEERQKMSDCNGNSASGDAGSESPVAEAERLLAKITPGDWDVRPWDISHIEPEQAARLGGRQVRAVAVYRGEGEPPEDKRTGSWSWITTACERNAEFIAAAPRLLREFLTLLQAQDSQPAQVAQPSNHPVFVAGPADAGSHEQIMERIAVLIKLHDRPYDAGGCEGQCVTCDALRDALSALQAASASAPAAPRETQISPVEGVSPLEDKS